MSSLTRLMAILGLAAMAFGGACSTKASSGKGSETSWLSGCMSDDDCQVGQCVCGVCTVPCAANTDCPGGTGPETCAASESTAFSALCGVPVAQLSGICLRGCGGGAPCTNGFVCTDGACLPETASGSSAASGIYTFFAGTMSLETPVTLHCLPMPLDVSADGSIPCTLLHFSPPGACDCSSFGGLATPDPRLLEIGRGILRDMRACDTDTTQPCASACACEVGQYAAAERASCLSDPAFAPDTWGYCYVDPYAAEPLGDRALVADCPSSQRRVVRVGGSSGDGSSLVMACTGHQPGPLGTPGVGQIGAPCVPSEEHEPGFPGFQPTEVSVDLGSSDCATGACLVNHFRGRVTCAYGQPDPSASSDPTDQCFTPDAAHERVTAQVDPWIARAASAPLGRKPDQAVYCSCRCDGPDKTQDYCQCPSGFECTPLIPDIGNGTTSIAGSYCIKSGTDVSDPTSLRTTAAPCVRPNCGP